MPNKINPQEIYLLERYTSLVYFGEMRDAWGGMIEHVETCLDRFVHNLPLDYRNRPLHEQPDIVWGERVLPNFRNTFQGLCDGYIRLSHGDTTAFGWANGPIGDSKGQYDFWSGWMSDADEETYRNLLSAAVCCARNINSTEEARWNAGALVERYDPKVRGPLDAPAQWPQYRLVPSVHVATGAAVAQTGIYVPSLDNSCAQYLSPVLPNAPEGSVLIRMEDLFESDTKEKYGEKPILEKHPCIWTLVERISDTGGKSTAPTLIAKTAHRVPAGQPCPEAGYYFTPAHQDSRRKFAKGEIMPELNTQYGATIWQWDPRQE
jgi:hypothetical protein